MKAIISDSARIVIALASIAFSVFVIVTIAGCGGTGGNAQTAPSTTATAAPFPSDSALPTCEPPDKIFACTDATDTTNPAEGAPAAIGSSDMWGYDDGLTIQVPKVTRFTFGQYDSPSGKSGILITVKATNGSTENVDMTSTTLDVTYGASGVQAESGYSERAKEFSGILTPGRTATGVFAFAVPRGTQPLTVQVSPGFADYGPALFEGTVK